MNDEDLRIAETNKLTLGSVVPTFGMGVPYPKFLLEEGSNRRKFSDEGDFVILFVGELSHRKNQAFLIKEVARLRETMPDIRLWLVGEGEDDKSLKTLAESLRVSDRIVFFGRRKNPQDFMRDADIYVSPSTSEGLPFNIVEALGCGKTVLASDVKGHSDILGDGVGVLYKHDSSEDFEEKLKMIRSGEITVPAVRIAEGYRNFSETAVFSDTYSKIKEAGEI